MPVCVGKFDGPRHRLLAEKDDDFRFVSSRFCVPAHDVSLRGTPPRNLGSGRMACTASLMRHRKKRVPVCADTLVSMHHCLCCAFVGVPLPTANAEHIIVLWRIISLSYYILIRDPVKGRGSRSLRQGGWPRRCPASAFACSCSSSASSGRPPPRTAPSWPSAFPWPCRRAFSPRAPPGSPGS